MTTKSKKVVYLVRHGQSEDNASPVFQSYESPLSEKGKRQAKHVADRVATLDFDLLISSPQRRAHETAEAISERTGQQITTSDLFVERGKPNFINGKSWDDPEASSVWKEWEKSLHTSGYKVQDGENYDDIVSRADKALVHLKGLQENKIVVVSHGYFIRTIVARVLLGEDLTGHSLSRIHKLTSLENTGITVLHYKNAFQEDYCWRLWSLNDHAHFAE